MSDPITLAALLLCLLGSALYSGSETALYGLSRVHLELQADGGRPLARILHWLVQSDGPLLVTILVGNNLMLELASGLTDNLVGGGQSNPAVVALIVTAVLAPTVFLFGEVLPKELFRRRPHRMLGAATPLLIVSRIVFWPVERVLTGVIWILGRMFGLGAGRPVLLRGRSAVASYLEEGARQGTLPPRAADLARNAMGLRSSPVERCMTPWAQVECLQADSSESERLAVLTDAVHSRLPVVGQDGTVRSYVHLLEVLGAASKTDLMGHLRPLMALEPQTPIASALLSMRGGGRRMALVGSLDKPLGLVALKDLVEEITGDVVGL
ncbi:MAG: hypothetical protein CMJ86_04040 [Planctomycetes bacterium]|nr:hypothetical protein [Planctomycetota bacterium]